MSDGILLQGLDGSNPLAFLAALGTLRTLTLALPDEKVRMSWEQHEGAWRPRVFCSLDQDVEALIERIQMSLLNNCGRKAFEIGDNLNLPAIEFRERLCQCVAVLCSSFRIEERSDADFLAAFGSEVIVDHNGLMTDTALRTMSGAGHQHFLKFFRELAKKTDGDQLRRTLLLTWDYADDGRGLNLRWDPLDDRRYALRWDDPSGDPTKTMRGANRLAIEAIPFLPAMPVQGRLATTCFDGRGARDTCFCWPLWEGRLNASVVASLLPQVLALRSSPSYARASGIVEFYRSNRITTGKFRNFTPGEPVGH